MKTIKKIVCGLLIAAPLFLLPAQSRAGGFDDFYQSLFGRAKGHHGRDRDGGDHDRRGGWDNNNNTNNAPAPAAGNPGNSPAGNSVPINGGLIILLVSGLGLATKVMYGKNKTLAVNGIL